MNIWLFFLTAVLPVLHVNSDEIVAGKARSEWLKICKWHELIKLSLGEVLRAEGQCEGILCVKDAENDDENYDIQVQHCQDTAKTLTPCMDTYSPFPSCCSEQLCTIDLLPYDQASRRSNIAFNPTPVDSNYVFIEPGMVPAPTIPSIDVPDTTDKINATAFDKQTILVTEEATNNSATSAITTLPTSTLKQTDFTTEVPRTTEQPEGNTTTHPSTDNPESVSATTTKFSNARAILDMLPRYKKFIQLLKKRKPGLYVVHKVPKADTNTKSNIRKKLVQLRFIKRCEKDFLYCLSLFLNYIIDDTRNSTLLKELEHLGKKSYYGNHSDAYRKRGSIHNKNNAEQLQRSTSYKELRLPEAVIRTCQKSFRHCLKLFLSFIVTDEKEEPSKAIPSTNTPLQGLESLDLSNVQIEDDSLIPDDRRQVKPKYKLAKPTQIEKQRLISFDVIQKCKRDFFRCASIFLSFIVDDKDIDNDTEAQKVRKFKRQTAGATSVTNIIGTRKLLLKDLYNEKIFRDMQTQDKNNRGILRSRKSNTAKSADPLDDLKEPFSQFPDDHARRNYGRDNVEEPQEFDAVEYNFK